jgi:ABC-type antimicrobial peptide transport system permease subunit
VNILPLTEGSAAFAFDVVGRPRSAGDQRPTAEYLIASPGYFPALRIPVLAGRTFTETDAVRGDRVVVVDELVARRLGGMRQALGERLLLPRDTIPYEIIGIVRTVRDRTLDGSKQWPGQFYFLADSAAAPLMTFVVRGPIGDGGFVRAVREAIGGVDPAVPPHDLRTMEQVVTNSIVPLRTVTLLLGIGAAFGLALAAIGIFGVMATSVARRQREFGIRLALGATGARIGHLVIRQALFVAVVGTGLGLLGAWAVTRTLSHLLYEVPLTDPAVFVAAVLCIGLAVLAAAVVPVHRANAVDPITTLRSE